MITDKLPVNSYAELRKLVPDISCVYFIYSGNELIYIGKSRSLKHRFVAHHRALDFETLPNLSIQWEQMDEEEIHSAETSYIKTLSPRLNEHIGVHRGNWRRVNIYIKNPRVVEWLSKQESPSLEIERIILDKIEDTLYVTRKEYLDIMECMKKNMEEIRAKLEEKK